MFTIIHIGDTRTNLSRRALEVDIMERWIKELERNTSKRKAMRKMRKIVRLKIDDGLSFADIARILSISVEDCKLAFANAVDGVDFASDSLSESEETTSEWGPPVPANEQAEESWREELYGSTVEILMLEIDEYARLNRKLQFRTGNIRYDGSRFIIKIYIEGED